MSVTEIISSSIIVVGLFIALRIGLRASIIFLASCIALAVSLSCSKVVPVGFYYTLLRSASQSYKSCTA